MKNIFKFLLILSIGMVSISASSYKRNDIQTIVDQTFLKFKKVSEGKNANYIPYLDEVDSDMFGISVIDIKGNTYSAGEVKYEFGIESISKVMMFCLALEQNNAEDLDKRIGVNATGQAFNSVLAVETLPARTVNPLVNAGAIATNSIVVAKEGLSKTETIDQYMADFAGRDLDVIQELFTSEMKTNQHNVGIAVLLDSYERMYSDPYEATESYTRQCSYGINTVDLAIMAGVLANNGINPKTGKRVLKEENVSKVLAVMSTAGLYDTSGEWFYYVGLPAKSGVGGGIMAVAPGKYGIAAFAPPLDKAGNSVKAQLAIKEIADKLKLNLFK